VRLVFLFLVYTGLCIGIGNLTANQPVEYRDRDVPGPTVTKTIPPVVHETRVMPESCKTAIALADQRTKAASVLDNASSEQLGIISSARRELASTNKLNELETQQRQLQGRVVAAILVMSNTEKQYAEAYATCKEETK
jgi:hypothetical protein